jgi:hypothetical protein
VLALNFLPCCQGGLPGIEVGVGDGGRVVGREILLLREYGVVASCAVRKAEEIGLEDRRMAKPVTAGAVVAPPGGRRTLEDLTHTLLNRQRHPV